MSEQLLTISWSFISSSYGVLKLTKTSLFSGNVHKLNMLLKVKLIQIVLYLLFYFCTFKIKLIIMCN